ncbi:MAG: hypothetical protein RMJ98_13905 [Myxococcales bacterium]|nr:hypothetical protein [Polyangiaceae bacterium]MDW8250385.1 hypothetical protein [Myxococcales bacterium]
MGKHSGALALVLALLMSPTRAEAIHDPFQEYFTLETTHFRVHYPRTLEPLAEDVADIMEDVHDRLVPALGHQPREVTHVVLTDGTEAANGSASALPYNVVRLFATAPDDMSPLADYDDWLLELTTHEYTHILHIDNIRGLPALLNVVLGKSLAPNQLQPRWIIEGLAVLHESEHTSGGRNRSSVFDMYLRANVLEGKMAGLDQISHGPRRWPMGNFWYLYGSRFLTWIHRTYGEHAMRTVAADYGKQPIPFGINRSIRRATGRTYEELYEGWKEHLERLYRGQMDRVAASPGGIREGIRLTHHGRTVGRPRWVPEAVRRWPGVSEVLYYLEDGHHRPGFYRMFVPSAREAWESDRDLWIRTVGEGSASFARDGTLFFSSIEPHRLVYSYSDLFRLGAGKASPEGDEPERVRLSQGQRAIDPDVRFDGRQLTFGLNRRGTQYLAVAEVGADGTLGEARVLIPAERYQQAYTPRYGPDGRKIAYSSWSRGGYRDIRIADVASRTFVELNRDRAMDLQPSWGPDGKTLFFSSDRTGIHNIYAHDLETGKQWQVTNVRTGAFMPEVAPDGKTLLYVGYTSDGFDLFGMELDRSQWTPALEYQDDRPAPRPRVPRRSWPKRPYNPWPTLRPFAYSFQYGPGTFGQTLTLTTGGQDAAGFHGILANLAVSAAQSEPQFSLTYTYGRLPFDVSLTIFRALGLAQQVRINDTNPTYPEDSFGIFSTISTVHPRAFDWFSFSASYAATTYDARLPLRRDLDPQSLTTILPSSQRLLSVVRLGFAYSNQERYLYSVGPARGLYLGLSADVASRETGSDYSIATFNSVVQRVTQMPWHPDHSLHTTLRNGLSTGNLGFRGTYFVGGYVDLPLLDGLTPNLFQGGFLLRGYPPGAYAGRQFHLVTAEYRFPLWHPERGISTLPIFLNRLSAQPFLDYGGAFDDLNLRRWREQFHTGYGAELLVDLTFSYFFSPTMRLGYARGGSAEAYEGGKVYMVLSGPL